MAPTFPGGGNGKRVIGVTSLVNETRTTYPGLPLTAGVVGPGMVVTIALETHDARVAADEAMEHTGRLLLVPRIDDRFATVGTVAKIEDTGDLPGGGRALVVRGIERA